jgi:hypothetical protein
VQITNSFALGAGHRLLAAVNLLGAAQQRTDQREDSYTALQGSDRLPGLHGEHCTVLLDSSWKMQSRSWAELLVRYLLKELNHTHKKNEREELDKHAPKLYAESYPRLVLAN